MSWFAVAHKPTATILTNLTLADTGEPASFGTSKIMGVMLTDWLRA
ncbi:MAG: hypothetical protein HOO87_00255 [Methyloglobulus sp.]|nr:hypothetical protein [Methyloglobulus sp.]